MRAIAHFGLFLFIAAFLLFTALLFSSSFSLNQEVLLKIEPELSEKHSSAIISVLSDQKGQVFSKFEFVRLTNQALDDALAQLPDSERFGSYTRGQYQLSIMRHALTGWVASNSVLLFFATILLAAIGGLLHFLPRFAYEHAGIKNNGIYHSGLMSRGVPGIILGSYMILFYILIYFKPHLAIEWIVLTDPLSVMLNGGKASQWFLYGFLYCIAVLVMGVRMMAKYRHNKYQLIRTLSVIFFQLGIAFLLPELMKTIKSPHVDLSHVAYDLKNIWPLDYSLFFDYRIKSYAAAGTIGWLFFGLSLAMIFIAIPLFTYLYGKRWYCSWVCGCGGLAETLGDPFRQQSDKSLKAWKVERYLIHGVLVLAVVMTGFVLYTSLTGKSTLLGIDSYWLRDKYVFGIGSVFAGVVGTGFYPLMGNRVWCRFGCPLAAIFGMIQRFKSRFRITTNGAQCISCGNCSTYCEMGIDVRWYAQRGQDIVRSSCVGCGVCSAVCPRGVLRLENGDPNSRKMEAPIQMTGTSFHLIDDQN